MATCLYCQAAPGDLGRYCSGCYGRVFHADGSPLVLGDPADPWREFNAEADRAMADAKVHTVLAPRMAARWFFPVKVAARKCRPNKPTVVERRQPITPATGYLNPAKESLPCFVLPPLTPALPAGADAMTMIHQCDRCGYQGRVIELADRYLCEDCDELYQREERAETPCAQCGSLGVTSSGICYACENSAPAPRQD